MKKILLLFFISICITTYSQCHTTASAKGFHTLSLHPDGTLWSWGQNNNYQIGNNSNQNQLVPLQIGTSSDWVKVSGGTYFSAAIKSDGTLWAWGSNSYGQTGSGVAHVPQMVNTDTDWVNVAAGLAFTAAIKSDGSLWMWGYNDYGQLGNGTTISSNVPAQVGDDHDWVKISCGSQHIIALKSDGTIWAWGNGEYGVLGQGFSNLNELHVPTQIGTDNNWTEITAGYSYCLGIKSNGTLWAGYRLPQFE